MKIGKRGSVNSKELAAPKDKKKGLLSLLEDYTVSHNAQLH
jgi:hypothetical protein